MFNKYVLTMLVSALAALAFAGAAMAQSSAQIAYQQAPSQTPGQIPEIPSAVVVAPVQEPTVAGQQTPPGGPAAQVTPVASIPTSPTAIAGTEDTQGGTLPVTGFDALLILGAAVIAGGVGLALRRAAAAR